MDMTIADLYGNIDNAVSDLKRVLRNEPAWTVLLGKAKLAFQDWITENASHYKDGDKIDWIGAFYDWLED